MDSARLATLDGLPVSSRLLSMRGYPVRRSMSKVSRQSVRRVSQENINGLNYVRSNTASHTQNSLSLFLQQLNSYKTYKSVIESKPQFVEATKPPSEKESAERRKTRSSVDMGDMLNIADQLVSVSLPHHMSDVPDVENFYATLNTHHASGDGLHNAPKSVRTVIQNVQETPDELVESHNEIYSKQRYKRLSSTVHYGLADSAAAPPADGEAAGKDDRKYLRLEPDLFDRSPNRRRNSSIVVRPEFSRRSTVASFISNGTLQDTSEIIPVQRRSHYEEEELERQRVAWELLQQGETKTPVHRRSRTDKVIGQYETDTQVHNWIEGDWQLSTHVHEEAALKIQKAYRTYVAKSITARLQYMRYTRILEILRAEEEFKKSWQLSCKVLLQENQTGGEAEHRMKMMRFFVQKVTAVIMKKRAKQQAEEEERFELETYAATLIQKMWRGYYVRKCVADTKSGVYEGGANTEEGHELPTQREVDMAIKIQSLWRSFTARKMFYEVLSAVHTVQGAFRIREAKKEADRLRREREAEAERQEQQQAVRIIERFYKRVQQDRAASRKKRSAVLLVQRTGRGYFARDHMRKLAAVRKVEELWKSKVACRKERALVEAKKAERQSTLQTVVREDAALVIQQAWRQYRCV